MGASPDFTPASRPPNAAGTRHRLSSAAMRVAALVVAAGRGDRLGHELPKAFVPLAGKPMLLHALAAMAGADEIDRVVPVAGAD